MCLWYFLIKLTYFFVVLSHQKIYNYLTYIKETRPVHLCVTMNIFETFSFLFKSLVKIKLSYVFTINMFSTAEICMEK